VEDDSEIWDSTLCRFRVKALSKHTCIIAIFFVYIKINKQFSNRGILADVIAYIFAHLHRALRTEGKVLDIS